MLKEKYLSLMYKLATYASDPTQSKGRFFAEKNESLKDCFLKDRERIIHSVAFRRLEYKTQVFVNHMGDHYRTRLTHTLEVSQVTRTICRQLNLNEDLGESVALCHDLGHPPFGHAGEDGLNNASLNFGGFEHNLHTIKIITQLEHRFPEFKGLNLTWETIEGVVKHNGPLIIGGNYKTIPKLIEDLSTQKDLLLTQFPSLEAQIANLSDDIAYITHDIDDGIRAGLFKIEELEGIDLPWQIYLHIIKDLRSLQSPMIINELIRQIYRTLIDDLIINTLNNIKKYKIVTPYDVRNSPYLIAEFSENVENTKIQLKKFLMERVYRNHKVNRMSAKGQRILRKMFKLFIKDPQCLPNEWFLKTKGLKKEQSAEIIIDYIAGMTDRYAIEEYKKLFDPSLF